MNKKSLLIVGLGLTLILVLPFITGYVAESSTHHLVSHINANGTKFGEIIIKNYDRGYRSSDKSISWRPPTQQKMIRTLTDGSIQFDCQGSHGLINYSYKCTGKNAEAYQEFVKTELNGKDPVSISGDISLFGSLGLTLDLQGFELESSIGKLGKIKDGRLELSASSGAEDIIFWGDFDGFEAADKDENLVIEGVQFEGNLQVNQLGMGIGSVNASAETLTMSSAEDGMIKFNRLSLAADSQEQGDDLKLLYTMMVDHFQQSKPSVRNDSELELTRLFMEMSFKGLNMKQLAILRKKWKAIPSESNSDNKASMLALIPEIEALLKSGLAFDSRLAADYESKPLNADLTVALVADLKFGDFLLMKINPQTFLSKFNASLNARVPEAVVELSPAAKNSMLDNPFYVRSDNNFNSQIELSAGELVINGNVTSFEQLMNLLMQK